MGCSLDTYRLRIGVFNIGKQTKIKINSFPPKNNSNNNTINTIRLLILFLILSTVIPNTHYTTRKTHNKTQHTKHGNNTLKLLHWNKGKAHFQNKINDIDNILSNHKPHIISLCEANIERKTNNDTYTNYMDYRIEHTKMSLKTNQSRNVIMIKDDIIYKRREDLEDKTTSTIWIEMKLPKNKPILIASIYR